MQAWDMKNGGFKSVAFPHKHKEREEGVELDQARTRGQGGGGGIVGLLLVRVSIFYASLRYGCAWL